MLTAATLGLAGYGLYSAVYGAVDLFRPESLDIWADLTLIVFGLVLTVSAAFVRVLIPGGLVLAIGALLGLEAIAVYNSAHFHGRVLPLPLVVQGGFSALLVLLAYVGERKE
jgi:hypothetical protein